MPLNRVTETSSPVSSAYDSDDEAPSIEFDRYGREIVHLDLETWCHPTCGKTLIFPTGEVPHFCRFCNRDIEPMYMIELNENLCTMKGIERSVRSSFSNTGLQRVVILLRNLRKQIMRDGWIKFFALLILWFSTMFAGGALFQHLEQPHYNDQKARYLAEVDNMKNTVNDTHFQPVMDLCERYHRLPRHNIWKFNGATFFAVTVATTVGYGSHAPQTDEGKIAFILFSICAIGWTLLTIRKLLKVVSRCFRQTERYFYKTADLSLHQVHFVWFTVTTILIACLFLSQAYFYVHHNKWSLLQSCYFLMTTFTTVGIGDVIPEEFMSETGVIEHALPLLIGIAFLPVWMWAAFNWLHIMIVKCTFRGKRKLPDIMDEAGVRYLKYTEKVRDSHSERAGSRSRPRHANAFGYSNPIAEQSRERLTDLYREQSKRRPKAKEKRSASRSMKRGIDASDRNREYKDRSASRKKYDAV